MQGAFPRPWLLARHQKLSLEKFSHAGPVAIGNTPVFFFATKAEPAFGALRVIVAADLARGTGRFNLIQGLIATGVAIGASSSNLAIAQHFGYDAGFLALAAIAAGGFATLSLAMPETMRIAARSTLAPSHPVYFR
jgi:hypothetical protein